MNDFPIMDSLSRDVSVSSPSDSGFDENSVDSSVLTNAMLEEEQKLQRKNERQEERLRREYEKKIHDEEMKKLRYKRLMHLLEKSQFYANFMHEKVKEFLSEDKSKKTEKNKEGTKRKKGIIEDYSEEIAIACKKRKTDSGSDNVMSKGVSSKDEYTPEGSEEFTVNAGANKNIPAKEETRVSGLGVEVPVRQPKLLEGAALRDYQLDGLNWLKLLFETGMNGILADEMGLGKTVQIISLICHLYENNVPGPFLIVGPLSTLPNWLLEFNKFAPQLPVILYHGPEAERAKLRKDIRKKVTLINDKVLPVVLTSYEIPIRDESILSHCHWKYIIVDEGHRLKNHKTQLARVLSSYKTVNRLLLTGTPLQNSLSELWSLLHFLLPDIFDSLDAFEAWFQVEDIERGGDVAEAFIQQERKDKILTVLHQILTPFLLRRVKSEVNLFLPPKKEVLVYCPLTPIQRKLYEAIIDKSILNLANKEKEESLIIEDNPDGTKVKRRSALRKTQNSFLERSENEEIEENDALVVDADCDQYKMDVNLRNVQMLMRKAVNHPYLIQMPVFPGSSILRIDERLVSSSGKFVMLDGLLSRLKQRNHKVLIFSTFTTILDLLEEYLVMRSYDYERLDGQCSLETRKNSIYRFNTDENVFVFLISTRAGGLGINLTAADTVIIYDSDWNPQADLQAQDRCHRIGQTRPVIVYRFITGNTYDEKIATRAAAKRKLEKIIIYGGKFNHSLKVAKKQELDFEELKELLNKNQHSQEIRTDDSVLSEDQWNNLLDRSDLETQRKQTND